MQRLIFAKPIVRCASLIVVCWLLTHPLLAQQGHDNYQHLTLQHAPWGRINYHVDTINQAARQPVLLWLDGSGCVPIRLIVNDGQNCCLYWSSIMIDEDSLAKHYHVVLISKPGIPYQPKDTIKVSSYDAFNLGQYIERERSGPRCGAIFNQHNSLNWRAGPALSQFYDFVLYPWQQARSGELTPEAAQDRVDTLLTTFRAITRQPTATDKFWEGNMYKRWASYTEPMADKLLKLAIPVYVAVGTNDKHSSAENADVLPVLSAQPKTNLTYRVCPTCNHWFTDTRTGERHWKRYFEEFLTRTAHPDK